jgi:predicted metal-dependent HD superfamily phosphohydrolase
LDRDRWNRLLTALGIGDASDCFDALLAAYSESHRHYHTTRHIDHCLREFDSVPSLLFRRKRAEILESFLARPRIYTTELFGERYESQARHNLAKAIERLRA